MKGKLFTKFRKPDGYPIILSIEKNDENGLWRISDEGKTIRWLKRNIQCTDEEIELFVMPFINIENDEIFYVGPDQESAVINVLQTVLSLYSLSLFYCLKLDNLSDISRKTAIYQNKYEYN